MLLRVRCEIIRDPIYKKIPVYTSLFRCKTVFFWHKNLYGLWLLFALIDYKFGASWFPVPKCQNKVCICIINYQQISLDRGGATVFFVYWQKLCQFNIIRNRKFSRTSIYTFRAAFYDYCNVWEQWLIMTTF